MVVNMYIMGPKQDPFKPVFFSLFDFSKMKRPRPRLQKTNTQSFSVLVLFGLSPVQLQSFASPRTGLSNTTAIRQVLVDLSNLTLHLIEVSLEKDMDTSYPPWVMGMVLMGMGKGWDQGIHDPRYPYPQPVTIFFLSHVFFLITVV